jgi:Ran GTPase-activating protein (RanGAP) involved in mRNA processing and transport
MALLSKNSKLVELSLSDNEIGDIGGIALSHMVELNESIKRLNLSMNAFKLITFQEMQSFIVHNRTIEQLDLSKNSVPIKILDFIT